MSLSVTIDGVWFGNLIYWTLTDRNNNYSAIANSHTLQYTTTCANSLLSASLHQSLPGDEFQQCSRSYRLATVPQLIPRLAVNSHQPPTLLTSVSRLFPKSDSKSHCDRRSVSKSWCRVPSGAHDQTFIIVWQLRSWQLLISRSLPSNGSACHSILNREDAITVN
jgi:hypothetical protein